MVLINGLFFHGSMGVLSMSFLWDACVSVVSSLVLFNVLFQWVFHVFFHDLSFVFLAPPFRSECSSCCATSFRRLKIQH